MKKLVVLLTTVLTVFSLTLHAGDDKKAITEVIDKELKAFADKDIDTWSSYWVHEPYVHALYISSYEYDYVKSFDSLKVNVEKWMAMDDQSPEDMEKKVQGIYLHDDMATVYLKEYNKFKFMGLESKIKLKSTYILKKVEDEWKFVSMTTFNKTSFENNDFVAEWTINMEGYRFMQRDELDKAIKVFTLNTELYPDAFNTWDSLAEAYMKKGDTEKAIKFYKKSIELNEKNTHAQKMIDKMGSKE